MTNTSQSEWEKSMADQFGEDLAKLYRWEQHLPIVTRAIGERVANLCSRGWTCTVQPEILLKRLGNKFYETFEPKRKLSQAEIKLKIDALIEIVRTEIEERDLEKI